MLRDSIIATTTNLIFSTSIFCEYNKISVSWTQLFQYPVYNNAGKNGRSAQWREN